MATSREPSAADNNLSSLYVDEDIQTVVNACLNDLGRPPPPSVSDSVSFFRQLAKEPPIPPTKEIVQARMDQQRTRHKEELEIMYDPASMIQQQSLAFNTSVEWLSLAFAQSQLPLVTMLNELEERRNIVLPKSLAEFNLIKAPTHQVRVARFFEGKTGPWAGIAQNSAEIEAALLAYKTDVRDSPDVHPVV
ncbi:SubName: Full=Uncharacterized protein {ECO:0000313/EMBL:CCA68536.1} [Serendipita indica DSM 11827]|nr:SubName: Full=Uncharacterized protein {ECO:0000313/EMBL:CCA68536.1} [Serendipita indica DSM 11827]